MSPIKFAKTITKDIWTLTLFYTAQNINWYALFERQLVVYLKSLNVCTLQPSSFTWTNSLPFPKKKYKT